jgi:hypothetical protein
MLVSAGLLDVTSVGLEPHNWRSRQYKSDVSTARVKQYRERHRNVSPNVTETPPEQSRTETEQNPVASATDATASDGTVLDLKKELWRRAKALLGKHGIDRVKAGTLIGKWLKECGPPAESQARLLHILASAETNCEGNIVEYVTAAIGRGMGTRKTPAQEKADGIRTVFVDEHESVYGPGVERDSPGDQDLLPAPQRRDDAGGG